MSSVLTTDPSIPRTELSSVDVDVHSQRTGLTEALLALSEIRLGEQGTYF